jgi:colanic acid biosynthesis glycosyl transferase WcaI
MKVLYLTQWFEPEPAMKGLGFVQELQARGIDCDVATGFPNYPGGRVYPGYAIRAFQREQMAGVQVDRLPLYPSHDSSSFGRALNYLSFLCSALIYLLARGRRYDAIYIYHPPVTPALAAALLTWWLRTPFVIDIQDLWPDSVEASGMRGAGLASRVLNGVCDFIYRQASAISVQSVGIRRELAKRGVPDGKLHVIYNWADEQAAEARGNLDLARFRLDGHFTFVYAGNFGKAQALEVLVEAAKIASRKNPRIRLLLVGTGVEDERIRERAERSDGVAIVHDPIPKADVAVLLKSSDVLVAHLRPTPLYEITIPSKIPFYMAVGRPILAAIDGEAGRVVTDNDCGLSASGGDAGSIADAMIRFSETPPAQLGQMSAAARSAYSQHFAFASAMDATASLLRSLGSTRKARS